MKIIHATKPLSTVKIAEVYRLRWRIENIFKSWKSCLHLQKIIPQNIEATRERIESIVYMMLIFIIQFQLKIYNVALEHLGKKKQNFEISLAKISNLVADRFNEILNLTIEELIEKLFYYCKYDKRKDRKNFNQKIHLS